MRIFAIHLLNDYSGSPKVLMQLLHGWVKKGLKIHLYTSSGREGFLSDIKGIKHKYYWYRFSNVLVIRLLFFFYSQLVLFLKLFFQLKKDDIVYINTVLPFGAAIAGKLRGSKVYYHIHETSIKPKAFKSFLFGIVKFTATKVVYVSHFLAEQEPLPIEKVVLYNVLEDDFVFKSQKAIVVKQRNNIVLMICSLKKYKGVDDFIILAKMSPEFEFRLVVNAAQQEIDAYFKFIPIPDNVIIYPTQTDTHPFYKGASIILNLSDAKLWVETFGLTILEAMSYGLPAIVPPVGGVVELVTEGENGFLIDSHDHVKITEKLKLLLENSNLYQKMSAKAIEKSKLFSEANFETMAFEMISN